MASVRRGEEQNIFPYQEEADAMFNSALIYELAVLKQYVEPLLFGIPRDCDEYVEAKRLLNFWIILSGSAVRIYRKIPFFGNLSGEAVWMYKGYGQNMTSEAEKIQTCSSAGKEVYNMEAIGADLSFVNLGITFTHLPNSISVFGFRIAFYGVIIGLGMLAGMAVAFSDAKAQRTGSGSLSDFAFTPLCFPLLGARLYYVAFEWDNYKMIFFRSLIFGQEVWQSTAE